MVIEKILKVNSADPKAEELRQRLAALQAQSKNQQSISTQAPPATAVTVVNTTPTTSATPPAPSGQTPARAISRMDAEIQQLKDASIEDKKRFVERKEPAVRLQEERTLALVMVQLQEMTTVIAEQNKKQRDGEAKVLQLEKSLETFKDKHEELLQKMNGIDSRLEKFMGLYELITNQYNPFAGGGPGGFPQQHAQQWSQPPQATTPVAQPAAVLPSQPIAPAAPAPAATAAPAQPAKPAQPPVHFAVEDSLTNERATVTIKHEDALSAQASFKRVEELLADLQKAHAQPAAAVQPTLTPKIEVPLALTTELHTLLSGFESRLTQQLDAALQQQLHERFGSLETRLQGEIRDALRDEIEAVQREDREVNEAFAELQALVQAREGAERSGLEEELAALQKQLGAVRDDIKAIPPQLYFRLADGHILKDLKDLRDALETMPAPLFAQHVSQGPGGHNDFATWVEQAIAMPDLAALMRQTWTPHDMRERIVLHDGEND